jgi:sugar lactone lactonase YvrE
MIGSGVISGTNKQRIAWRCLLGLFCLHLPSLDAVTEPKLEVLFQLPLAPAGLTMTPAGGYLLSVSFEEKPQNRVVEVDKAGISKPFPTLPISQAAPGEPFVLDAVEGMQLGKNDIIWLLDNGRRSEITPRVIAWEHKQERLHRIYHLVAPAVLPGSVLDDLALDPEHPFIYLADPATGTDAALIVLNTNTGLARRVLQGHPSVVPVTGLALNIDGLNLQAVRLDGSIAENLGGVNSLALDRKGEWLYFAPLRSERLYRIKTEHLRNAALPAEKLAGLVEEYATKPMCDGITLDTKGNIYISDLAGKAIGMIAASSKQYEVLVSDPRLLWPDGLCFGPDGKLFFFNNARKAQSPGGRAATSLEPPATNFLYRLQTPGSGRTGD